MAWLTLIKFRYHVTFASVACGALLFASRIDGDLARRLLALYLCFNVLLYGGIYTCNDIADRIADARHPRKRHRPIAAGKVSVRAAALYAAVLIGAGLTLGAVLFSTEIVACFVAALAFNAFYSTWGRNLRYLDVLFNSVTHPTRFLMGALLAGRIPPATHLVAFLLLAMSLSCLRRDVERDEPGWRARKTLGLYSPHELPCMAFSCLAALAALAGVYGDDAPGFYAIVLATAAVVAAGGWLDAPIRSGLRAVWTQ